MNEYDSNRIADLAKQAGYIKTSNINNIDCYILNTCHIREKATEKVYSDIGRLKKSYRNKKKPIVLVVGCVAQAENDEMLKREPFIDAVIGPQSYHHVPKILSKLNSKNIKLNFTDFNVIEKFDKLNALKNSESKVSSFITIQEGCDKFCNFCVVPYTRGSEYSRSPEDIMNEARNLILNGAKEITLLGQNVNAYHYKKVGKNFKLHDLIMQLDVFKKLRRIRYTTSHPNDMSKELINCYKYSTKLMPFLHLPVQSGSNKILKSMNRKHGREKYLSIIQSIKSINPKIEFSSDFIVGYPGEDENDFFDTISLIKEVNFINSFSFIYDQRPGTPAANFQLVEREIQKKRLNILQSLLEDIQREKNLNDVGKSKEVLVENRLKDQKKYFGRSQDLTPVIFDCASDNDIGEIVNVKIKSSNQNSLFGVKQNLKSEVAA